MCSGKHWREQGGDRDLQWSEVEHADRAVLRCVPTCLTWRRGQGRCGGAPERVEGSRGRRWLRWRTAVLSDALGTEGKSEAEDGEDLGEEWRETRGLGGALGGGQRRGGRGGSKQLPGGHACSPCSLSPLPPGEGDDWQRPVGPGHCWAGVGRQVSQVNSFSYFLFLF